MCPMREAGNTCAMDAGNTWDQCLVKMNDMSNDELYLMHLDLKRWGEELLLEISKEGEKNEKYSSKSVG